MADPRFYDNQGPFTLAALAGLAGVALPKAADGTLTITDVAALSGAGVTHLSFFVGGSGHARNELHATTAGACFVSQTDAGFSETNSVLIPCKSVQHAFARAVQAFYPDSNFSSSHQQAAVDSSAIVATSAVLGHGVVVGEGAEIGEDVRIGHNAVIGRGVTIGRDCEIGSNVTISHAYLGDGVVILPGAQIGQSGFGFASGPSGHVKIPQIGRVIIQDKVEIGACTTIDRGALGDTVIGEGTKIDNLVQIGHNTKIGRHCIIVAQVGISGSCELGDFVVLGGQAGVADHARVGDGARLAARGAIAPGDLPGNQDYGGVPARPLKQWKRELAAVAILARRRKRDNNG
ncbi:MAG TPA: UDP-3-O-(3-hydroxymyristoyl)glucosamine N-acyltransferase [Rhizomicrobium sp.]|jgi:UDP-3-O-[3-hydroxymyristoyl] glucosamine N-acyltransferase|nr:UDP-3-O-(3-hydroxymyristoyl)glucosamine N-acyltransferase [Rhizomicrobium sp.]